MSGCQIWLGLIVLGAFLDLSWAFEAAQPIGPFCPERDGQRQCQSRKKLCGCASGSCETHNSVNWQELRNLDFTGGVVRMATFRNYMDAPSWLTSPSVLGALARAVTAILGGSVEQHEGRSRLAAPNHAWNEIELPGSSCYLLLGGQTSTLRDTTDSAFRLVLHDTTFRWWTREPGKLTYEGLLLHEAVTLSQAHVDVLRHLIDDGTMRAPLDTSQQSSLFERSTDQDSDLNPLFLEFPPMEFRYTDHAYVGMASAYVGLFGIYRSLSLASEPVLNCVVVALLFGKAPHELLSMIPTKTHIATRAKAAELNELWLLDFHPIIQRSATVFKETVETAPETAVQPVNRSWWQQLMSSQPLQVLTPSQTRLNFQEQITHFGQEFLDTVIHSIQEVLTRHDPSLSAEWARSLQLTHALQESEAAFRAAFAQTAEGCLAESSIEQMLFCPDWRRTKFWLTKVSRGRGGHIADLTSADVVKETNIAIRKLLFWDAANALHRQKDLVLLHHEKQEVL